MVMVLIVDKCRRHEESIVVELWHLRYQLGLKKFGSWREAGLLGCEAKWFVVDVGVGAEVCD